jgi:hypothetical protein
MVVGSACKLSFYLNFSFHELVHFNGFFHLDICIVAIKKRFVYSINTLGIYYFSKYVFSINAAYPFFKIYLSKRTI